MVVSPNAERVIPRRKHSEEPPSVAQFGNCVFDRRTLVYVTTARRHCHSVAQSFIAARQTAWEHCWQWTRLFQTLFTWLTSVIISIVEELKVKRIILCDEVKPCYECLFDVSASYATVAIFACSF